MYTAQQPREKLYTLTESDCAAMRQRLQAMQVPHTDDGQIHALCFAGYANGIPSADGPRTDEYYTLQYLHCDPSYLLLRLVGSEAEETMVTEEECRALLAGETDWLLQRHNPLLRRFHEELTEYMLLPRILLSCTRERFTLPESGMVFTFHHDLRSTMEHMDFLDPQRLEPELEPEDTGICLHITAPDGIPDEILCLIRETAPRRRRFGGNYLPS